MYFLCFGVLTRFTWCLMECQIAKKLNMALLKRLAVGASLQVGDQPGPLIGGLSTSACGPLYMISWTSPHHNGLVSRGSISSTQAPTSKLLSSLHIHQVCSYSLAICSHMAKTRINVVWTTNGYV